MNTDNECPYPLYSRYSLISSLISIFSLDSGGADPDCAHNEHRNVACDTRTSSWSVENTSARSFARTSLRVPLASNTSLTTATQ